MGNSRRCVSCAASLELERTLGHSFLRCPMCRGIWIEMTMLRCMITDMAPASVLAFRARDAPRERPCPDCGAPMPAAVFNGVNVERCEAHGIWFERDELQRALEQAAAGG